MKVLVQFRMKMGITLHSEAHTQKNTCQNFFCNLHLYLHTFTFNHFHFKMAFHKSLNTICNLNDYLVCKMPKGTLEIEVKVKTTWGKFTLAQNTHTQDRKVLYMGKAPAMSYKIQKKQDTPQGIQCAHRRKLF